MIRRDERKRSLISFEKSSDRFKLSSSLGNTVNSALTIRDEGKCPEASDINILVGGILSAKLVLLEGILMMVFQNVKLTSWSLVTVEIQFSDIFTKMHNDREIYF